MYGEDFVRMGGGGHGYASRHPNEHWDALAEFAKKFVEEYYPEDHHDFMRRAEEYSMHNSGGGYDRSVGRDQWYSPEYGRYRGQPRTASGRFKSRYGHDCEHVKERIGCELAESHGQEWLIEKAIKEAGEFIKAAADKDDYQMFREFCELCIVMKGVAEFVPAELEEQACEKALEYYSKKAEQMRYSNPLLDEYHRRARMY